MRCCPSDDVPLGRPMLGQRLTHSSKRTAALQAVRSGFMRLRAACDVRAMSIVFLWSFGS
eukprot:15363384-Alexandrium_andersonii.AAC.1